MSSHEAENPFRILKSVKIKSIEKILVPLIRQVRKENGKISKRWKRINL